MRNTERLVTRLGRQRIPTDVVDVQLAGWGMARLVRTILGDEVAAIFNQRNAGLPHAQQFELKQILQFSLRR